MNSYYFIGIVLPERAQISFIMKGIRLQKADAETEIDVDVNIINNQVLVQISSTHKHDIFDLRNIVKTLILNQLAAVSYLKGYAYDFDVTRVYSKELDIDYVFGVEIPYLEKRGINVNIETEIPNILRKTSGSLGVFVNRCLSDLSLAIKHADDTAFYCYRAIESLRQHCACNAGLQSAKDSDQWECFRKATGCNRNSIDSIKLYADPLRHGKPHDVTSDERAEIFKTTWDIVDGYLNSI